MMKFRQNLFFLTLMGCLWYPAISFSEEMASRLQAEVYLKSGEKLEEEAVVEFVGTSEEHAQHPCIPTAENILGPYYRANAPFRTKLVHEGQVGIPLLITGQIVDTACNPIEGALIEVWQTDHQGEYDNESQEFRFRGCLHTDARGQYQIETVVPGSYAIGERVSGYGLREAVYRPRHVHFKITAHGFQTLITQLYFKGDPYNDKDPYVVKSLIAGYETHGSGANESWTTTFDIVLEGAKE